jgi:protease IV
MENNVPPQIPPPIPPAQPPILVAAPARRGGGKGWMLLSFVLIAVLGLFLLNKVVSSAFRGPSTVGTQSGRVFHEVTVENPKALDKVAVIDVAGMITSAPWDPSGRSMVDVIEDQLKLAAGDDRVRAVILKIDSPGGEVLASDDISRAIVSFQEKNTKPIVAAMGGLAASGGYYVAAPCRWIVANELTITGSIGVIMQTFNYRGLMDKVGVDARVFKSGRFKDMLRGSKRPNEMDPAEDEMIQNMIMDTYAKFKSVVRNGRTRAAELNKSEGRTLVQNWEEYADGRILTGKTAHELGFVDQLGNFRTAIEKAYELANISEAHIIRYQEPFSLARLFGMRGMEGRKSETKVLKVDLGIDLPKLEAGRLYFLSPTVVQ